MAENENNNFANILNTNGNVELAGVLQRAGVSTPDLSANNVTQTGEDAANAIDESGLKVRAAETGAGEVLNDKLHNAADSKADSDKQAGYEDGKALHDWLGRRWNDGSNIAEVAANNTVVPLWNATSWAGETAWGFGSQGWDGAERAGNWVWQHPGDDAWGYTQWAASHGWDKAAAGGERAYNWAAGEGYNWVTGDGRYTPQWAITGTWDHAYALGEKASPYLGDAAKYTGIAVGAVAAAPAAVIGGIGYGMYRVGDFVQPYASEFYNWASPVLDPAGNAIAGAYHYTGAWVGAGENIAGAGMEAMANVGIGAGSFLYNVTEGTGYYGATRALNYADGFMVGMGLDSYIYPIPGQISNAATWSAEQLGQGYGWANDKTAGALDYSGKQLNSGLDWTSEKGRAGTNKAMGYLGYEQKGTGDANEQWTMQDIKDFFKDIMQGLNNATVDVGQDALGNISGPNGGKTRSGDQSRSLS